MEDGFPWIVFVVVSVLGVLLLAVRGTPGGGGGGVTPYGDGSIGDGGVHDHGWTHWGGDGDSGGDRGWGGRDGEVAGAMAAADRL
jgi:hypothetical protein